MEIQQLKLLAGRVRTLLEQSNLAIGHNQSLDLVAALPGLRNWPEVVAFPERVTACELDGAAASRLAFRLKSKFEVELRPQDVLTALSAGQSGTRHAPQIWPAGPTPGVYVTTSQKAIDALLKIYEEASDGALVYAERAGNRWEGSIDLGENGLWSNGLHRVASGTLFIVGPLELDQQSWQDHAGRLEVACRNAQSYEHRVAVLFDTPTPQDLRDDAHLLVRSAEDPDLANALLGIVTDEGELQQLKPFARKRPQPVRAAPVVSADAIPTMATPLLREALAQRKSGLLLFGSAVIGDRQCMEFIAASLALTEHAGPAARVMPRHRSTPAKDWLVPEAIKQLPFLPSIESAYDQGYRRLLVDSNYTDGRLLAEIAPHALIMAGTYGSDVKSVFLGGVRGGSLREEVDLLKSVIALLGVLPVATKHGVENICDLFVLPRDPALESMKYEDIEKFLDTGRALRWQDQVADLLDSGKISQSALKKAVPRNSGIPDFLAQRRGSKERIMREEPGASRYH